MGCFKEGSIRSWMVHTDAPKHDEPVKKWFNNGCDWE